MQVTRKGFTGVVNNAFAGLGFPADAATIHEFPIEMFVPGSDLTPINENIDKVIYGLTKWEPTIKEAGVYAPPKVTVEGRDYQEAVANMNLLFLKNLWSDGLPILPATEESVNWILTGTDLPRDTVIGKILPRGGIATVEQIAASLAMAGGRPEYLPVLIAAVEAIIEPGFKHQAMNATTNSVYPVVMVNGPVAKQIRLNSGYGCLGPDPQHPANASIGRAIRFLMMDMGGAIPGIGTMAIYGGPAKFTNIVFAEDEEGNPWEPLHVELGFSKESNVVTVNGASGTANINHASVGTEETALAVLNSFALFMMGSPSNVFSLPRYDSGSPGTLLMARGTAQGIATYLGWSKEEVKTFLWENSKIPWSVVEKVWSPARVENFIESTAPYLVAGEPWPITARPENIMIVVAGGEQSGHGYWMQQGSGPYDLPISKEIKLPANWDELIKESEEDLGPIPAG